MIEQTVWRLYVHDGYRGARAELDSFEFSAVLRHNQPGSWSLEAAFDGPAGEWLSWDVYGEWGGGGIFLERDTGDGPETIFAGVLESREIEEAGNATTLRATGRDALVLLEDRWVDPVGGTGGPDDYSAQAYDSQSGAAETVMRHYVTVNTDGTRQDRYIPMLVVDPGGSAGSGGTTSVNARFDNLLTLLQQIATAASPENIGLRIKVVPSTSVDGQLVFKVETPRDLREHVVFDRDEHNVSRALLREVAPSVNAVVVAGQNEGERRVFVERSNVASISHFRRRIERFVDQRQEADETKLLNKALDELVKGAGGYEFEVEPIDGAPYRFGRDYDLGDRVTVRVAGQEGDGIVREVKVEIGAEGGVRITPLIGPDGASFTPIAERRSAALASRVSYLERIAQFGTVGMIVMWFRDAAEVPVGWAICNGSTVNGFATPDLRGRVPVGVDGSHALGAAGGALTASIAHTHNIAHTHTIAHTHNIAHTHETDIDHNHAVSMGGPVGVDGGPGGTNDANNDSPADITLADDVHEHVATADHIGATLVATSSQSTSTTSSQSTSTTSSQSTNDSGAASTTSISIEQPWLGVYWICRVAAA